MGTRTTEEVPKIVITGSASPGASDIEPGSPSRKSDGRAKKSVKRAAHSSADSNKSSPKSASGSRPTRKKTLLKKASAPVSDSNPEGSPVRRVKKGATIAFSDSNPGGSPTRKTQKSVKGDAKSATSSPTNEAANSGSPTFGRSKRRAQPSRSPRGSRSQRLLD